MDTGVVAASVYLPAYRRPGRRGGGARLVTAGFDEDAVTMAVEAVRGLGRDRLVADALLFVSSSLPYAEKSSAVTVALAAGLGEGVRAVDMGHGWGTVIEALAMAGALVRTGEARAAVVVAADCRRFAPGSAAEGAAGDAAVALLVGAGAPLFTLATRARLAADVLDTWRADGEWTVRESEEHFREEAAAAALRVALSRLASVAGGGLEGFTKLVLPFPDVRRRRDLAAALGIGPERLAQSAVETLGFTGTPASVLDLLLALETSQPGDRLLWLVPSEGADACLVEVGPRRPEAAALSAPPPGLDVDLATYRSWRGVDGSEPWARVAPAPHALWREAGELLRFEAGRCRACGLLQYPPQRVCARCGGRERESVSLADSPGRVFTYSLDYVAGTPDLPLVHVVVDFEAGARAMMMLTDRDPGQVRIGMPVRPTFRRAFAADGIQNYLWKVRPAER